MITFISEYNAKFNYNIFIVIGMCFFIMCGYINSQILTTIFFMCNLIDSIRSVKNNDETKSIVNNWILYCTLLLIFYCVDSFSYFVGNMFSVLLEMCKLVLLFCLCTIEGLTEKILYGITRIYSCNNKIIDSVENNIIKFGTYIVDAHEDTKNEIYKLLKNKIN